jgi:aromatic-L-amino-acid/L-tryptophan decarboxylase
MKKSVQTLNMDSNEFRTAGFELVEQLAQFLEELPGKKVTTGENPTTIRALLNSQPVPNEGTEINEVLKESTALLFEHSLFNGHPRFWGYITSSATPVGALADLIVSTINANVGAFALSPIATEIENQTVQWLAELIGYQKNCGGLFVSGGNMANFIGFLAARKSIIKNDIRKEGLPVKFADQIVPPWGLNPEKSHGFKEKKRFIVYCAKGTHTWIEKATDMFGHGMDSIRFIDVNNHDQMNVSKLQKQISSDRQNGHVPFLVVGNAGTVSTGAIDPLDEIASLCHNENIWFHIDGAYGAPAAMLPETASLFKGINQADSIALDPHKWLYSPIEAGCILVRNEKNLHDTFSFSPVSYNFDGNGSEKPINYHEYGMQNSRGFKAFKVWLSLKYAGRKGISKMIRDNIELAQKLFELAQKTPEIQAVSQNLSITTFRYVPYDIEDNAYLNLINEKLLNRLQSGGEVFLSNAIVNECYCLRVCIVNFRTTYSDLETLIKIVLKEGSMIHEELLINDI